MDLKELNQALANVQNGAFIDIGWMRECKTRKAFKHLSITKATIGEGLRVGVQYDNKKAVQDKRETGELPAENMGLRGEQEWYSFPFVIFNPKNGKYYLRVTTMHNSRFKTQFFLDGQPVEKETVAEYLLASEKRERQDIDCFQVNIANVRRLHTCVGKQNAVSEKQVTHVTNAIQEQVDAIENEAEALFIAEAMDGMEIMEN